MTTKLIDQALEYGERGWALIPCHSVNEDGSCTCSKPDCRSPGKHPILAGYNHTASSEKDYILRCWEKFPYANIGIVTGEKSGIVVIDVDPKNGGFEGLEELEGQYGPLPDNNMVDTGGGGYHFYFSYPETGHVSCAASKLPAGIDVRGSGGIIIAPPSKHASGKQYTWRNQQC